VTGHIFGAVALLAVVSAGGTVWLLVRDKHGRSRVSSARALRRLTAVSALVVLVTVVFLRPWTWDLAIAALVVAALVSVHAMVRSLEYRVTPARWGAIAVALVSVVLASALVTLGGAAAVVDGAALVGGKAVPVPHDHQVLAHPVLYQVFWGSAWDDHGGTPALTQAVAFQRALPSSQWASEVVHSGFGVGSLNSGGCWLDPSNPPSSSPASSTSSGPFPDELRRVFDGHTRLVPCPGFGSSDEVPRALPADAVVALWLDPKVPYELGGVSAHSSVPWPGRPDGLVTAGLTGGFAAWGLASCARSPACQSVPGFASPTYALSHEFLEATTNPFGHGWYADVPLRWAARYLLSHGPTSLLSAAPAFEGEVADLCQPGQPSAPVHRPVARLGPRHVPVADFYRPGTGCVS
jgi:hypothetical protein